MASKRRSCGVGAVPRPYRIFPRVARRCYSIVVFIDLAVSVHVRHLRAHRVGVDHSVISEVVFDIAVPFAFSFDSFVMSELDPSRFYSRVGVERYECAGVVGLFADCPALEDAALGRREAAGRKRVFACIGRNALHRAAATVCVKGEGDRARFPLRRDRKIGFDVKFVARVMSFGACEPIIESLARGRCERAFGQGVDFLRLDADARHRSAAAVCGKVQNERLGHSEKNAAVQSRLV